MRTVASLAAFLVSSHLAFAHPPSEGGRGAARVALASTFDVASDFEPVFLDLLEASPTLRSQYERIASAPAVRVRVTFMLVRPFDRNAQTEFRGTETGALEARIEIATPLRTVEYAEWLGHELEHVLEQMEGLDLYGASQDPAGGVVKLADGSYETDRARRAGRQAALDVKAAASRKK
jgi:hypothetical protein